MHYNPDMTIISTNLVHLEEQTGEEMQVADKLTRNQCSDEWQLQYERSCDIIYPSTADMIQQIAS